MESVIQPLAKSVLIPLGLTAAALAALALALDAADKKILGSSATTTLIISNDIIRGRFWIIIKGKLVKQFKMK